MREEIQALQASLSLLRNIYINAEIDDYGNAVIGHEFPIFRELQTLEGRLERVIASALAEGANDAPR